MIKILITDFDDTLYSWVDFFVPAFYEMAEEVSKIIEVPMEQLLYEYKEVHQLHRNVEYPYSTLNLPSVKSFFGNKSVEFIKNELNPAFHKFNSVRKHHLNLFGGVKETLKIIKESGIKVVGYTESAEENGVYRVKKLGIEKLFDRIYVSKSKYSNGFKKINDNIFYVETKKPNPTVLERICSDMGYNVSEAIYIGDSFTKDIYMANEAHICSVWYKQKVDNELYRKLVDISHWTEEDFKTEKILKEKCIKEKICADYEIENFSELISIIFKL